MQEKNGKWTMGKQKKRKKQADIKKCIKRNNRYNRKKRDEISIII